MTDCTYKKSSSQSAEVILYTLVRSLAAFVTDGCAETVRLSESSPSAPAVGFRPRLNAALYSFFGPRKCYKIAPSPVRSVNNAPTQNVQRQPYPTRVIAKRERTFFKEAA